MPRIPIPLVGPSSKAASLAQQSARTVNLYPEINDPDARALVALHHVPGFESVIDISDQFPAGTTVEMRGFHRVGYNRLFFVANERIYEAIDFELGTVTHWASLDTFSGQVGISDNNGYLVIGDNSYWTLNLNAGLGTATLQPVLNNGAEQLLGWYPRWVDGYTIYPLRNSSQFFWSAIDDPTTVDGLAYATAEGDPDNINNLIISNRELVFLGGRSTEFWAAQGGVNAFDRIGGGFQSYGIACRYTAAECGGFVVFVGRHTNGEGQVVALANAGTAPQRLSTPAVELDIAGVLAESLMEQVTGFYQEDRGKRFYFLNLPATSGSGNRKAQPSKTWVCDLEARLWHERGWWNGSSGAFERIKAQHHTLLRGVHYVSTYDDAAIYKMDRDVWTDVGAPLIKLRESAGPVNLKGQRFRVNKLGVEMEVGVGLDGSGQGSDPKIMLQYRWGQGAWSNEIIRSIGKIGEGKTLVRFGPMGSGHDFSIRVSVSDPVPVTFTGAWADVVAGG